jgi:MobA/MobL family
MAIFRLDIRSISRSAGQRVTAAAAYLAGERSGGLHDFSRRKDVVHTEIFLPSHLDASSMDWARDRTRLWNTAEEAEKRRTSRVAREYQVTLPSELAPSERLTLARAFSRELADRYGVAVDLALHEPRPGGDLRNFHAHLLTTTREVTPTGLGAKAGLDMQTRVRAEQGLASHSDEYAAVRERWAILTNDALREAKIEARVDHAAEGASNAAASLPVEEGVAYPKNIEEIQREAVQAWLRYRAEETGRGHEKAGSQGHRERQHDDKRDPAGLADGDELAAPRGPDSDFGL